MNFLIFGNFIGFHDKKFTGDSNYLFKIVFKKIGNKKNLKFNTKKLKKYVFFDVNFEKILFECF